MVAVAARAAPGARGSLRGRAARRPSGPSARCRHRRTSTSRCARSATPTTGPRSRATSSGRRRSTRCSSSSCTAPPTSSRRPTPTRGRSPRLSGPPKAALVEIQADEYGGGRPSACTRACSPTRWTRSAWTRRYGAYLDRLPALTLATVNLMSLFGLHRRLRGAIVGHLALFEMTSSIPNRRYAAGLRRLGSRTRRRRSSSTSTSTADAVHEAIAAVDLAGGLARCEPDLAADILCGASALVAVEGRWAGIAARRAGRTAAPRCAPPRCRPLSRFRGRIRPRSAP